MEFLARHTKSHHVKNGAPETDFERSNSEPATACSEFDTKDDVQTKIEENRKIEAGCEILFGDAGHLIAHPEILRALSKDFETNDADDSVIHVQSEDERVEIKGYVESRHVISDGKLTMLIWDLVILALVFFTAIYVPFQMAISQGFLLGSSGFSFLLFSFINACFCFDIALTFFRPYRDKKSGYAILRHRLIVRNYLTGWFWVDLLSVFPSDGLLRFYCNDSQDLQESKCTILNFVNLLRLFRLRRVSRVMKSPQILKYLLRHYGIGFKTFVFMICFLLFVHWSACILAYVALLEIGSWYADDLLMTTTWATNYISRVLPADSDIIDSFTGYSIGECMTRYIVVFYWAVVNITSIGYGDIYPVTIAELWVVTFVLILGSFGFASLVAFFVGVLGEVDKEMQLTGTSLGELNLLMNRFVGFSSHHSELEVRVARSLGISSLVHTVSDEVRHYIYSQKSNALVGTPSTDIADLFPVIKTLPAQLQQRLIFTLASRQLSCVRSLLHPSVGFAALAALASQCRYLVQAHRTHLFVTIRHPNTLGVYVIKKGMALFRHNSAFDREKMRLATIGSTIFADQCCVSTAGGLVTDTIISFHVTTEMLIIPRKVFKALMKLHPGIWKDHGRWYAAKLGLRRWALGVLESRRLVVSSVIRMDSNLLDFTHFKESNLKRFSKKESEE